MINKKETLGPSLLIKVMNILFDSSDIILNKTPPSLKIHIITIKISDKLKIYNKK